jgi:hypothetical protein
MDMAFTENHPIPTPQASGLGTFRSGFRFGLVLNSVLFVLFSLMSHEFRLWLILSAGGLVGCGFVKWFRDDSPTVTDHIFLRFGWFVLFIPLLTLVNFWQSFSSEQIRRMLWRIQEHYF